MQYTIDAQNKKLGRLATEIAVLLMGKNNPDFARNKVFDAEIKVVNADKIDILSKKLEAKIYKSYSGYPGGLKETGGKEMKKTKGTKEMLKKAVYGMLPKNKLRDRMIKNLTITN